MDLTTVYDCIGTNLPVVLPPPGVLMAGYVTGTGNVPWPDSAWLHYPDAIRIDQWPAPTAAGTTADLIDVENGAVTIPQVYSSVEAAQASYRAAIRPGQRWPAVYVEQSEVTPVVNALLAKGITSGVPLFLTEPMPEHAARDILDNAGGPFPMIGVQYEFHDDHDVSLVSTAWLNNVAKTPVTTVPQLETQTDWLYCHKCQGLFFGPGQAQSVCPRGMQHDGTGSFKYTLGFIR